MTTASVPSSFNNVVLSGASTRLLALLGAYAAAEERGHTRALITYAGTSAGAIIAFLLCLGLTAVEAKRVLLNAVQEYSQQRPEVDLDALVSVYYTMGVDDGEFIVGKLRDAMEARLGCRDMTFLQYAKATGKHLIVCVSNITDSSSEYWSVDTRPQLSVMTAVRASISLPFLFTPVVVDGSVYGDGGLFENFPIATCAPGRSPFCNTLGICVQEQGLALSPADHDPPADVLSYALLLLHSLVRRANADSLARAGANDKNSLVCVLQPSEGDNKVGFVNKEDNTCGFDVDSMRFALSREECERMYQAGHARMVEVLQAHEESVLARTNCCSLSSPTLPTDLSTKVPSRDSTSTVG